MTSIKLKRTTIDQEKTDILHNKTSMASERTILEQKN